MHVLRQGDYKHRKRPQMVTFKDEISGVLFSSTVERVKNAIYKATNLLQFTSFVALEEFYSFLGITETCLMLYDCTHLDLSYSDPSNVLGWHLLEGIRKLEVELVPKIDPLDNSLYVELVYDRLPEFWDIRDLINPAYSDFCYEEFLNLYEMQLNLCINEDGEPEIISALDPRYSSYGIGTYAGCCPDSDWNPAAFKRDRQIYY